METLRKRGSGRGKEVIRMVGGIYGGYNASSMYGTKNYLSNQASSVNNFDYKAAQRNLLDQYKQSESKVQALKKDTANFLDDYTSGMQKMGKAADALQGQSFDKLLYGGAQTDTAPTKENVDKTASAVEQLVTQFNDNLKLLGNNADRGSGVSRQIGRMVQSPTSARSMELIGISTQKDGTLKVDGEKLRTALRDQPNLVRDVVGGSSGMAQGVSRDSKSGLNQSPASLIGNDLAAMKQQQMSSSFEAMSTYTRSGAYNAVNLNSVGLLMNIMI